MAVDLAPLGASVRAQRRARGWTLEALASRAGLSTRFLSDLERGKGNISIARLAEVARALGQPLSKVASVLDEQITQPLPASIALVGLRGAGKSTIGPRVADALGLRFVELDLEVEKAAGLPLAHIFEIHGQEYYRRLERETIARVVGGARTPRVFASGGGVVSSAESWALLKRAARTIWLSARPRDHYQRVMAQGDLRPMKNRPAAMAELRALLEEREQKYEEADLSVDTSALGIDGAVGTIVGWLGGV